MRGTTVILAMLAATMSPAAKTQEKPAGIEPPTTGLLVQYRFWPEQFVQWVGNELPYSMIELDVDPHAGKPVFEATLTERGTRKRVHYSNVKAIAELGRMQDGEGYETKMDFTRPDAATVGAVYTLKFTLHDGRPVQWRFVQGSEITDQGAGMTPVPEARVPFLIYREEGGVAGEGTGLQIGNTVSPAEMWQEISHPPEFVAYHAALTHGSTTVMLTYGNEQWTVAGAPSTLTTGAEWKLTTAAGRQRSLKIVKASGDHYTIAVTDALLGDDRQTIEATHGVSGWSIERVVYRPGDTTEGHGFSLVFAPALSAVGTSSVDFVIGKKTKIASAKITTATDGAGHSVDLTMQSPGWAKGKEMAGATTATPTLLEVKIAPR